MIKKKRLCKVLAIGLAALTLAGCGSANSEMAAEAGMARGVNGFAMSKMADAAPMEEAAEYYEESYSDSYDGDTLSTGASSEINVNASSVSSNRKLIRTVNLTAQTTEYDELIKNVNRKITELGGHVESLNESTDSWADNPTRNVNMTVRIPKAKADEFISVVEASSNVTDRSENVEDVTLDYVDTESHKKALEAEQKRLLELMERAETIEDLITIESRLSDIRYQIESIESRLRTYDDKIDYTTIRIYIDEVARIVPVAKETFLSRISVGFMETLYDVTEDFVSLVEWFIISIPRLIVWAIIILFVIFVIIKPIRKKRKAKKEAKLQAKMEAEMKIRKAMSDKKDEKNGDSDGQSQ